MWANSAAFLETGHRLICIPEGLGLDGTTFLEILTRQIETDAYSGVDHSPETPVEMLLLNGLRAGFPAFNVSCGEREEDAEC